MMSESNIAEQSRIKLQIEFVKLSQVIATKQEMLKVTQQIISATVAAVAAETGIEQEVGR